MQQPLAIAVMGGLLFSTVFTLWLGPLIYLLVHRVMVGRVLAEGEA